jgi:outer membrane protein, multidrug efflux system
MRGGASWRWAATRARPMSMMLATCVAMPLGGCFLTDSPEPALTIPTHYTGAPNVRLAEARTPPLDWWRSFRSRELTGIIEDVRTSSLHIT